MSEFKRQFFVYSRLVHVYCSTALFSLLFFFSLTGIFLNHSWYQSSGVSEGYEEVELSSTQLAEWGLSDLSDWSPDITRIQKFIESRAGLSSPQSVEIDPDFAELVFEYSVPAGYTSVLIEAGEGRLSIEKEAGSLVGLLNDLHKGRNSGVAWKWLIDISAGLMIIFACTGVIILFQGRRYRRDGIISVLAGVLTPYIIWLLFVPSI